MRVFANLDEFAAAAGQHLGYSEWHTITQHQVDTFADATVDHQWIHVDPESAAQGPFGTTIAHGYLTLSLIPMLGREIYRIEGLTMGINYGLNKVRFPQAVPVGTQIRASGDLVEVTELEQGKQAEVRLTIEVEGKTKPACIAESLVRLFD